MFKELFRRKDPTKQIEQLTRNKFFRSEAERGAKILTEIPFVETVILTGSVATGKTKTSSDIDIIVTYEPNGYMSACHADTEGASPIRRKLKDSGFKLGNLPNAIDVFLEIPHNDLVSFLETGSNPYWRTDVKRLKRDCKNWITLFER